MNKLDNWWDHTPANYITLTRALQGIVGLGVYWYDTSYLWYGFGIYTLACIFDGLDGYVARNWNCQSWSGAFIDPIADRILEWSAYIVIVHYLLHNPIPSAWVYYVLLGLITLYGTGTAIARLYDAEMKTSVTAKRKQVVLFVAINMLLFAIAAKENDAIALYEILWFLGTTGVLIAGIACAFSARVYLHARKVRIS